MNRYKCPSCGGDQFSSSSSKAKEPCVYCINPGTVLMADIIIKREEAEKYLVPKQRVWLEELLKHIEWSRGQEREARNEK